MSVSASGPLLAVLPAIVVPLIAALVLVAMVRRRPSAGPVGPRQTPPRPVETAGWGVDGAPPRPRDPIGSGFSTTRPVGTFGRRP